MHYPIMGQLLTSADVLRTLLKQAVTIIRRQERSERIDVKPFLRLTAREIEESKRISRFVREACRRRRNSDRKWSDPLRNHMNPVMQLVRADLWQRAIRKLISDSPHFHFVQKIIARSA